MIKTDSGGLPDFTVFIQAANEIVNEYLVPVGSLTETRLGMIETWLAAHFSCALQRQANSESAGDVSVTYGAASGQNEGIAATRFGQTAITLDSTDTLKRLAANAKSGRRRKTTSGIYGGSNVQPQYPDSDTYAPGFYPG